MTRVEAQRLLAFFGKWICEYINVANEGSQGNRQRLAHALAELETELMEAIPGWPEGDE